MNKRTSPKKQPIEDWHPADVVAALSKAGWSFSRLSKHHGYATRQALASVQYRRWPKGQRLVAEAIGVAPEVIWPSRYTPNANTDQRRRNVKCVGEN